MKHYYIANPSAPKGIEEITEEEFIASCGSKEVRPYVGRVYRGEITLSDVPAELQEECERVVAAKIEKLGKYEEQPISGNELKQIINKITT